MAWKEKEKMKKTTENTNGNAAKGVKALGSNEPVLAVYQGGSLKRAVAAVRKTGATVKIYPFASSVPVRLNGDGAKVIVEGRFALGAIYTPPKGAKGEKGASVKTTLARVFAEFGYKPAALGGKTRADAEKRAREIEKLFKAAWAHSAETPLDDLAKSL